MTPYTVIVKSVSDKAILAELKDCFQVVAGLGPDTFKASGAVPAATLKNESTHLNFP